VTTVEVAGNFAGEGVVETVITDPVVLTFEYTAESVSYGGVEGSFIYFEDGIIGNDLGRIVL